MCSRRKKSPAFGVRPLLALATCLVLVAGAMRWMYVTERENLMRPHRETLEREIGQAASILRWVLEDSGDEVQFVAQIAAGALDAAESEQVETVLRTYLHAHGELERICVMLRGAEAPLFDLSRSGRSSAPEWFSPEALQGLGARDLRVRASFRQTAAGLRVLRMIYAVDPLLDGFVLVDLEMEPWADLVERADLFVLREQAGGVVPELGLQPPTWANRDSPDRPPEPMADGFLMPAVAGSDGILSERRVEPPAGMLLAHAAGPEHPGAWRIVGVRNEVLQGSTLPLMTGLMVGGLVMIVVLFLVLSRSRQRLQEAEAMASGRLEAERSRLELIVNRVPVPVFFQDGNGTITFVNEAFGQFLGNSSADIVGRRLVDLLPEEEIPHLLDWGDPLVFAEEGAATQETALLNHYGELRKVSVVVKECDHDAGSPGGHQMIGAIIDNTESVNAFQAMEDSLDLMTKVTSQVPGVVFEFKRRPEGTYCFPWASVGIQKIYELSPLDVEEDAKPVLDRLHPDDRAAFIASIETSARELTAWKAEYRVVRRDGEVRWMLGNSVPEREADGSILWHGFIADITDFKEIEGQLRDAKAEAEQANRAKSAFLAAMSHEIRTPMNGVIGMTSLLSQTELTEEQSSYVHTIRHSGDALLVVINDILDFSKIESGRLELELMPFDLAECVEGVVDILAPQAIKKGLAMAYYIDQEVPLKVSGDVTRVRQILVNLVGNAIKFTSEGEVFINVDLASRQGARYVRVAVEDTGAGIPESRRDRLFKPFSQVDSSTNRIYGGTGLGLAISKRLTEIMQGDLFFESVEGEGSSFYFMLPLDEQAMGTRTVRFSHLVSDLHEKRVLVVDDRTLHRVVIASYFDAWGLGHAETSDLKGALKLLRSGQAFDAILVDRHLMPTREEDALRREFGDRTREHGTRVLIMDAVGRSSENDWDGFLAKPIKAQTLCQALRSALLTKDAASSRSRRMTRPPQELAGPRAPLELLLVEDNRVNQKVATMIMGKLGYKPDIANDGREAVEACQQKDYDIILMDVQMPVMDGLEATRTIRDLTDDLEHPWIVALTANATTGDRDQAIENGMNDYLAKPIKLEDLRRTLDEFIQRRESSSDVSRPVS